MTVNTTVINQSSAMVEVTLKSFPNKDNWVGVWLLPNSSSSIDPKNHAPTKYKVRWKWSILLCTKSFLLIIVVCFFFPFPPPSHCSFLWFVQWCSQGQLHLSFQLINMRGVYQFGLLKGGRIKWLILKINNL